MEGKKKISVIGPAIIDVLAGPVSAGIFEQNSTPVKDIRLSFGGNALNETVVLKKLGCEARLVSKVGGDEAGFRILRMLEDQGIGTGNIAMERELATGINIVLYDGSGERRFLTNPDSSLRKLSEADIENSIGQLDDIISFSCMFVSPLLDIPAMERIFRKIREKPGRVLAVDMTMAKRGETAEDLKPLLGYVDYLLPNRAELRAIGGPDEEKAAGRLLEYGAGCVIVKKGDEGCSVYRKEGRFDCAAYRPEKVVDTTGAGDSFAAGFLAGLASGYPLEKCVRLANATASFCVESAGAADGVPSMEKIEERMGLRPEEA